jgi:PAS domain S-box-containing protein
VVGRIPIDVGLWEDLEFRAQLWESLRAERRIVDAPARCTAPTGRVPQRQAARGAAAGRGALGAVLPAADRSEDYPRLVAHRRESLYRDLFLSASEGIYRSLPGGGFLDVNRPWRDARLRVAGRTAAACCNRARDIYVDQARDNEDNARLLAEGRIDQVRVQVYRRDGSPIWVSENARVNPRRAGPADLFEGSLEDITAQVEAEQALKQSQALYQVLLGQHRDGVFLIQRGMVRFANRAMADILGYPRRVDRPAYMSLIDAEDAAVQESASANASRLARPADVRGGDGAQGRHAHAVRGARRRGRLPGRHRLDRHAARHHRGAQPEERACSRPSAATASCSTIRRWACSAAAWAARSWR